MTGESLNILQDQLEKLRAIFPEVFSEGKIDMEKFKATFSDDINFANERYLLNWAGKSDAFKVLQVPTTATLKPRPEQSINFEATENLFIEGENLEILKVLQKSYFNQVKCIIIDPPYNTGNDSFIYPDNFKENKADYEKRIGDRDEEGYLMKEGMFRKNNKDNGYFHSNWLSMMYPRLFLAKNLLRDDGVIFVHIDDNEVYNLRLLMNEIFGEENFVGQLVWEKKKKGAFLSGDIASIKEYILVFSKNSSAFAGLIGEINSEVETYPVIKTTNARGKRIIKKGILSKFKEKNYKAPAGTRISSGNMELILIDEMIIKNGVLQNNVRVDSNWIYSQTLLDQFADAKELYITQDLYFRRIVRDPRNKKLKDILFQIGEDGKTGTEYIMSDNLYEDGWGTNEDGNAELHELLGIQNLFQFSKPSKLIAKLIFSLRDTECLVLDFFAGSGTTAQAILELNEADGGNRRFILAQLPELTDESSEANKAGYTTISEISKERIRRVIRKIEEGYKEQRKKLQSELPLTNHGIGNPGSKSDLGFKVFKLSPSNFKVWRGNDITEETLEEKLNLFADPLKPTSERQSILYELILKAGYRLTDKVEQKDKFYSVKEGELIIALEEMNQRIIDAIIAGKPKKVITLDTLFSGNDKLKTNTALQMRDAEIDFKTL